MRCTPRSTTPTRRRSCTSFSVRRSTARSGTGSWTSLRRRRGRPFAPAADVQAIVPVASPAMTPPDGRPLQVEGVRRLYDRNTARFRRLGEGGASIHRAVWAPGVRTRADAFHHVDDVVLSLLADTPAPRVVDLGCGVGGSLVHLAARRSDLVGEGITISPAQVAAAATLIGQAGLAARVRVRQGDFVDPPADLAGADLALSIEAFVHGPDPAAYFRA